MDTEKIWNNFHDDLLLFINSKVHDHALANDVLQDVFIKIHLKLPTLSDKDKLGSWVYQITRNSITDHFRKQKHHSDSSVPEPETTEKEDIHAFERCLQSFIRQLPEKYKDALMQTDLGRLSQKEYAQKKGISYSGAKSRVQRAREQLKDLFVSCCKIEADSYGNVVDHDCNC